ncbi:MAG TPA: TetR/AcrR family transcriptional regulator [Anaeromyxobacteraceae bacterium]|nr:TetR/AcrR family transcriptional regulator [Anaeromyxobacteraceae bacterium]
MTARKTADSRRREIADAALKIIAEQGLARFTALAIAREVGVTDAALFRHFPTKEAIVLAVIDRVEEILFEGFPPEGADPLDRLGRFFDRRIAVIRRNPGVARLVASEQLAQAAPPEGVARVAEFRRRSQAFVRQTLAEAHRRGLLAPGLAPDEAAVLVLGALLALAHQGMGSGAPEGLPRRVWRVIERAVRRPVRAAGAAVRGRSRSTRGRRVVGVVGP